MKSFESIMINVSEYMYNNLINVDAITFINIIIGQVTVYGILLTFYQFVASYQGNGKSINTYLGINLTEYFIKKKVWIFDKIISTISFEIFFILEILHGIVLLLCKFDNTSGFINALNLFWFIFIFFFFLIFILSFFQCAKSTLLIKNCLNVKTNGELIRDINNLFLKKTKKEQKMYTDIELLQQYFGYLKQAIQEDENSEWKTEYNRLIQNMFKEYFGQKKKMHALLENKKNVDEKQKSWEYIINCEIRLLEEIVEEKYFCLDDENINIIVHFHMQLFRLNFRIAELKGYKKISCSRSYMNAEDILDVIEWEEVTQKLYRKIKDENKQALIKNLQQGIYNNQQEKLFGNFSDMCIKDLIVEEMNEIFSKNREQNDFLKIYGRIIQEERFNNLCSQILIEMFICNKRFDAEKIIVELSEENCKYIFVYTLMYYSIYRFRFKWEFIDVKCLKILWKRSGDLNDGMEVIERIRKSNINHRFSDKMYAKFVEYINADSAAVFKKVYFEKKLDVFYIWVIKTYVINHDKPIYLTKWDETDLEINYEILNELSQHEELIKNEDTNNWIEHLRYTVSVGVNSFPEKIRITLRNLLLTNIKTTIVLDYVNTNINGLIYAYEIGAYLLIKLYEMTDEERKQMQDIVRKAFVSCNVSVDEYLENLEKECELSKKKIDYVQKEKMKEYLIKLC